MTEAQRSEEPRLTDLLSCQCGGHAEIVEIPSQDEKHTWIAMMCSKCHQGPSGCRWSERAAERAWNEWAQDNN